MNPALASLLALFAAIILSMVSRINVGLIAMALAWLVGVYIAGIKPDAVVAGFPSSLFLTLTGVTLLFACAETNGALKNIAHRVAKLARGDARILPVLFFFIAFAVSTVGPGAISSVALIIPLAMAIANRSGLPPFLTGLMVANGANAGNLSPISAVGIIANTKMAEAGLGGHEWKVWFANFAAHALAAAAALMLFGVKSVKPVELSVDEEQMQPLTRQQKLTLAIIAIWIAGVLIFKLNLGLSAFTAATLIVALNAASEIQAVKQVPWGVIVMVCGVSLLIAMLEKTGGMDVFTAILARLATPGSVNGLIAFITGVISTYSSTSGVVLPAFLPTAAKLAEQLGGADPLAIALSINVGSSIVDVSPLSTLGALCLASVTDADESRILFRRLLLWGFSMTVAGAVFCYLFAGWLARF